jgi:hypothetical protein
MKYLLLGILALMPYFSHAQSKVMRNLSEEFPDGRVFMFYHSSLRMLNIEDDPDFDRMIRDIEKIKVLMIEKEDSLDSDKILSEIRDGLADEDFEELMEVKSKDYNIGVYILEDDEIEGFFLIMNEDDNLVAIDLVGSMPIGDIGQLVDKIKEAKEF